MHYSALEDKAGRSKRGRKHVFIFGVAYALFLFFMFLTGCTTPRHTAVVLMKDNNNGIIHFVAPYDVEGCGPQKVTVTDDGFWVDVKQ